MVNKMSLSLRLQSLSLGGCRPSALGSRAAARGQAVVPRGALARRVSPPAAAAPQLTRESCRSVRRERKRPHRAAGGGEAELEEARAAGEKPYALPRFGGR